MHRTSSNTAGRCQLPKLAEHVSLSKTGSGAALLDEAGGHYWQLNSVGYEMLTHLLTKGSIDETVIYITHRFEADSDQARSDLLALIDDLRAASLLRM